MDSTTKTSSLERMVCLFHKSNINRCSKPNKTTAKKWINTVKKLWINSNSSSSRNNQRKIQFKTRFRRLFRSVQRTKHCSVTLSSQQTMLLYTMIQSTLLSTPWTCQWLSGRDHKKYVKTRNHACSRRT